MAVKARHQEYKCYSCRLCKKPISEFSNWATEGDKPVCKDCKDIPIKTKEAK